MASRRPNLALAGKRETPAAQSSSNGASSSKRGRGRGRGRSDNGPKRGAYKKPELIQTGGVFSEGLGGDFPSRRKERDADVYQFSYKRKEDREANGEGKAAGKEAEGEKNKDGKTSFKGWDELWESDEELDDAELRSICPKGFISDLKKGTVMPYVLPHEDETQFKNLLVQSSRLSLEESEQMETDEKKPGANVSSTANNNSKTPEQLIAMIEASTSELIHLQLPSVIGSLCQNVNQEEENHEHPMEVEENGETANVTKETTSGLPNSRRIGKLQITRKGRLLLKIGGYTIDLTCKPTQGKQQGAVLLETEPTLDPMMSPPQQRFSNVQNAVYHLGNVKHNLVGSMSWNELNDDVKIKEDNEEKKKEQKNDVSIIDPDYIRQIQEIEDVHKDWISKAEKWARGQLD